MIAALIIIVVLLTIAGAIVLAVSGKRDYDQSNQVVPGVEARAPKAWAGAHTPEAKLHRRLRDAVAAVRTVTEGSLFLEQRATFENQALAIDDQLITSAALPDRLRGDAIARIANAVDAIEDSVGRIVSGAEAAKQSSNTDDAARQISEGLDAIAQARAELDKDFPTNDALDVARQVLGDAALGESLPDPAPAPSPGAESEPSHKSPDT